MEQLDWLKTSIQAFFLENGVPKPLTKVLAEKVSELVFINASDIYDADGYYENIQDALTKVISSDDFDYDLSVFVDKPVVENIRDELGVTSFGRAEVFNRSLNNQLVENGIPIDSAKKLSYEASNRILRSENFFNLSKKEAESVVANTITSMGIVSKDVAASIAQQTSVDFVLSGTPLESIEAVKILELDEFKKILNTRVEESLKDELDEKTLEEIKSIMNDVVFGSQDDSLPENEQSLGLSEHYNLLIESITRGGNPELLDLVYQQFHQYKFPSLDTYQFMNRFSKGGAQVTRALLDQGEDKAEEEMLKAFSQQSM